MRSLQSVGVKSRLHSLTPVTGGFEPLIGSEGQELKTNNEVAAPSQHLVALFFVGLQLSR
jgi:hypothetical protein